MKLLRRAEGIRCIRGTADGDAFILHKTCISLGSKLIVLTHVFGPKLSIFHDSEPIRIPAVTCEIRFDMVLKSIKHREWDGALKVIRKKESSSKAVHVSPTSNFRRRIIMEVNHAWDVEHREWTCSGEEQNRNDEAKGTCHLVMCTQCQSLMMICHDNVACCFSYEKWHFFLIFFVCWLGVGLLPFHGSMNK